MTLPDKPTSMSTNKKSFIRLLAKKPLAKVTVKEICELSEINSATFYNYYCDSYDFLENEFLEEPEKNVSHSIHNGFQETFTYILISIKAEGECIRHLSPKMATCIFRTCFWSVLILDWAQMFLSENLDFTESYDSRESV